MLVAVCVAALVVITGVAVQLAAVLLARHRAEVAADLAALAGAAVVLAGSDTACGAATVTATANGSELVSCEQDSLDLRVQVRVRVRAGPLVGSAAGRARAGPVSESAGR